MLQCLVTAIELQTPYARSMPSQLGNGFKHTASTPKTPIDDLLDFDDNGFSFDVDMTHQPTNTEPSAEPQVSDQTPQVSFPLVPFTVNNTVDNTLMPQADVTNKVKRRRSSQSITFFNEAIKLGQPKQKMNKIKDDTDVQERNSKKVGRCSSSDPGQFYSLDTTTCDPNVVETANETGHFLNQYYSAPSFHPLQNNSNALDHLPFSQQQATGGKTTSGVDGEGEGGESLEIPFQTQFQNSFMMTNSQLPELFYPLQQESSSERVEMSYQTYRRTRASGNRRVEEASTERADVKSEHPNSLFAQNSTLSLNDSLRGMSARWTETEEVILQGIVGDCSLVYGTQASWTQIAKCYQLAASKFCVLNGLTEGPVRTSCALKKHYRVMHNRIRDKEISNDFWYKVYHYRWMAEEFNKDQKLISYNI